MSQDKKGKKIAVIILLVLIILLALGVIGYFVLQWKPFDNQDGGIFYPEDTTVTTEPEQVDERINFLIVGLDESESLTDVILVASVKTEDNSVEILQIPRDSYVSKTISTGKINSMYRFGDENLQPVQRLIKVIYEQFRIDIDYYGIFTLEAFRNAVDAMGGVPVDMPYRLVYDPSKIIPKGEQVLNGEQAEWLVRHRSSYLEGDIGRIKAQRIFLAAAVQRAKDIGIVSLSTKVVPQIYKDISSDMSVADVIGFAKMMLSVDMESIRIHMVPGEGIMYHGQSVWAIHVNETAELLNTYFRPEDENISVEELGLIDIGKTGEWYEDTDDDFDSLINGQTPGQKHENTTEQTE